MTREFSISRVFGDMIAVVRQRSASLLLVLAALHVAPLILLPARPLYGSPDRTHLALGGAVLLIVLGNMFAAATAAALTMITLNPSDPRAPREQLRALALVLPAAFGLQLVQDGLQLAFRLMFLIQPSSPASPGAVLSLLVLIMSVWALAFYAWFAYALPFVVDQRRAAVDALERSWTLTRRRRWLLLGLALALMLVLGVFSLLLRKGMLSVPGLALIDQPWVSIRGMSAIVSALTVALQIIFSAALYLELRRLAGATSTTVAEVFD